MFLRSMEKKREVRSMVFYFVQRGETLYAIARRYQTTVHAIVSANRLEDPNSISPGQALIIPRPGEVPAPPPGGTLHLVRPGETVFHLADRFGASVPEILLANQIAHPEFVLPGQQVVIPEGQEAGSDWPMWGRTPGRTSVSPVSLAGSPAEGWSYSPREAGRALPSAPVIRYGRVYAGLGDGRYYAMDRRSGRVKWRVDPPGAEGTGSEGTGAGGTGSGGTGSEGAGSGLVTMAAPAVFDGLAYLCFPCGTVDAVDAHTGRPIWRVSLDGCQPTAPAIIDGVLVLGCAAGHLYALEAKTGAIAWRQEVGEPIGQPVAVGDTRLFAVTTEGAVWAVDLETGRLIWKAGAPIAAPPLFAELAVLCGGTALDPASGELLWQVDAPRVTPVTREDQVIYSGGTVDLFTGRFHVTGHAERTAAEPLMGSEGHGVKEPFTPAEGHGVKEPFSPAEGHGVKEPFTPAEGHGAKEPFSPAKGHGVKEPFSPAEGHGVKEPFSPAEGHGATEPFTPAEGHGAADPLIPDEGQDGASSADPRTPQPAACFEAQSLAGELLLGARANRLEARDVETGRLIWSLALRAGCCHPPSVAEGQVVLCLLDGSLQTYRFMRNGPGG